jgi:hypothetical protein
MVKAALVGSIARGAAHMRVVPDIPAWHGASQEYIFEFGYVVLIFAF